MSTWRISRVIFAVLAAASIALSGGVAANAAVAGDSAQAKQTRAQAATPVWAMYNAGSVGLGIVTSGWPSSSNYNGILPGGYTASGVYGVYIGSGYCAQRWTSTSSSVNGPWTRAGSDFKPGKHQLSGNYYVKIVPYRGSC
ncbi:hypothetical protein [Kineosporia babensis]|uniref:Uncharacterized protein n=1 Tax=Kineosporia babensis TaxID=499548 RepID=A0A9X1NKJ8_9ACTN|nr:hypothetical protein [Kineosporia babensis]MCD5314808.1 hypothetical protein [Kineosporia babensis]